MLAMVEAAGCGTLFGGAFSGYPAGWRQLGAYYDAKSTVAVDRAKFAF